MCLCRLSGTTSHLFNRYVLLTLRVRVLRTPFQVANVTAFDGEDELHTVQFEDGGLLKLALALEDFQLIFGKELEGRVRAPPNEPPYSRRSASMHAVH